MFRIAAAALGLAFLAAAPGQADGHEPCGPDAPRNADCAIERAQAPAPLREERRLLGGDPAALRDQDGLDEVTLSPVFLAGLTGGVGYGVDCHDCYGGDARVIVIRRDARPRSLRGARRGRAGRF